MGWRSPKKEVANPIGQHGRNAIKKPMEALRGKSKADGPRKPRKESDETPQASMAGLTASKPMGMARRGIVKMEAQWAIRAEAFS